MKPRNKRRNKTRTAVSTREVDVMEPHTNKRRNKTIQNNPAPFSVNGMHHDGVMDKDELAGLLGNFLPLDTAKGRNKLNEILEMIENDNFEENDSLAIGFDIHDPDLKIHTANVSIEHFKGAKFASEGDNKRAALSFEKTIAKNPTNAHAHYSLGTIMRRMGKQDKAMECFKRSVTVDPSFALGYYDIGLEFLTLGDLEQAMWYMDHALKLNPDLSLAIFGKGVILSEYQKYKEAIFYFDRALKYAPGEPIIYEHKAGALMMLGKMKESMKCLDQLEKIDPGNWIFSKLS